jgi:hypothetical protein
MPARTKLATLRGLRAHLGDDEREELGIDEATRGVVGRGAHGEEIAVANAEAQTDPMSEYAKALIGEGGAGTARAPLTPSGSLHFGSQPGSAPLAAHRGGSEGEQQARWSLRSLRGSQESSLSLGLSRAIALATEGGAAPTDGLLASRAISTASACTSLRASVESSSPRDRGRGGGGGALLPFGAGRESPHAIMMRAATRWSGPKAK